MDIQQSPVVITLTMREALAVGDALMSLSIDRGISTPATRSAEDKIMAAIRELVENPTLIIPAR